MSENEQKVAIVTGGLHGIVADIVAGYRDRGWAVVTNALTIKPSDDPAVLTVEGDISEPATADRIITEALARFGRVDTLVNNAGVLGSKPFTDYTAEDYALVVGVNLNGFFWLTQRAVAQVLDHRGGHMVSISATIAEVADSHAPTALAALTKGGLAALTRLLAIEYAACGIRVNAVSPGGIQTSMHPPDSSQATKATKANGYRRSGVWGHISDVVGGGVLFLESSPYITGEIVHIDGGKIAGH